MVVMSLSVRRRGPRGEIMKRDLEFGESFCKRTYFQITNYPIHYSNTKFSVYVAQFLKKEPCTDTPRLFSVLGLRFFNLFRVATCYVIVARSVLDRPVRLFHKLGLDNN